MYVDITQVIKIGATYREGSPPFQVQTIDCIEMINGSPKPYQTTYFSCAVHNMGTHIDTIAPTQIALSRYIGSGIKFNVSHISGRPVLLQDIDTTLVREGQYIFFQTNWDQYLHTPKYLEHPEISLQVVAWLAEKKVNMVGIDTPGLGYGSNHGTVDRYLAEHNIYAIENLCNLTEIPESNFTVYCFPLKAEALDAIPTRIIIEF